MLIYEYKTNIDIYWVYNKQNNQRKKNIKIKISY